MNLAINAPDAISQQGVLDEGIEFLPKPFTSAALLARVRALPDRPWSPLRPARGGSTDVMVVLRCR
jgi:DNA-binding response OmpR family regulator